MKTKQEIVNAIIEKTKKDIPVITNYRSGGIFYTFIQVAASFLEKIYLELDQLLPNRFLMTAKGEYLDLKAEELSLTRYPATKTRGYVTFSRKDASRSMTVNKDKIFATKSGLRYKVVADVVLREKETTHSVLVEAEEAGSKYNVVGNTITELITPIAGIDSISNNDGWIHKDHLGKDIETDESLRSRCFALWRGLSGANKEAYYYWTKSINGVKDVLVVAEARGLGTVDIVITADQNEIPKDDLIQAVQDYINIKKPIATDVLISKPSIRTVDLSMDISANKEITTNLVAEKIKEYFSRLSIGQNVEPSAITAVIFEIEGIQSVNIYEESIRISAFQIAQAGKMTINITTNEVSNEL